MLTKTKTLIDKYTDALVVTGLLLVIVITLSGNLSLSFGKDKKTVEAAPATVVTNAASAVTTSSANLNGNITASDSTITARGFEWGTDTSYGNTVSSNNPSTSAALQTQWGSAGSDNGQFNNPYGVAVSPGGNVYVTDRNNNRVQVFDSNGNYLNKWGSAGAGNGQFNGPHGIVVDSSGNVFVADTFNHRVQKFDSSGAYLGQFGGFGSGNGQFNTLYGLAKDASGNIYVADTGNQRIQKFNNSGVYQSQFGSAGSGNGQFSNPTNLAIASGGNIYVADNLNNRVQVFNSSGVYQSQFGSYPSMYSPNGIAINSNGFVYVEDTGNSYVRVYNSSNVLQTSFAVSNPPGIAADSTNHIYITSYAGNKVLKYLSEQYYNTGSYQLGISGLACDTTYHYRAYATNSDGTSYGDDQTFSAPCMTISTDSASYVGSGNTNLTGTISQSATNITARGFQWGSDTSYGNTIYDTGTPPFAIGSYTITSNVFSCDTTYHFRAYGTNSYGTYYGTDQTFSFGCMEIYSDDVQPTFPNAQNQTNLYGIINQSATPLTARGFQWGTDTSYGNSLNDTGTPPFSLGSFSLSTYLMDCGVDYHMRAYGTNSFGTFYGDDYPFNTPCMNIYPDGVSNVTDSTAEPNGTIEYTFSDIINRGFEWGTDTSYGHTVYDPGTAPFSTGSYSFQIDSLPCNTEIHYRPFGINAQGTYYGGDDTFTTLGCTTVNTLPASGVGATSALLNGDVTETLSSIIGQGFQLGTSTSYGTNITYTPSATTLGYKFKWGSYGSEDGQFDNPEGITRDNSGNIYVADGRNNRIQKFDAIGNYLGQFGSYGSGDGQFDYPTDVGITSNGNIYVVDSSNHRIQIFDSSFNYLSQFGSYGSGDGQFAYPWGMSLDGNNNIYIADTNNSRIQKFDSNGNYLGQFGSNGSGDGQFSYPIDVFVANNGNIYVADYNDSRVQIFDSSFNYLSQFGSWGTGDGQFSYIYALTIDNTGKLYVTDEGPSVGRVQIFDASGNYLSQFGSYGTGDGQFIYPEGIVTDNSGNVYVSSYGNDTERVQVFGPVPAYSTGPYSSQASGLSCGTTYHYRAYVTNAGGTYYGADQTFNTQACPFVPSSTTPTAKVNPNPVPAVDLKVLSAIGRSITLKSAPGGILGYIYRFLQALPHNSVVALPYLLILLLLVVALAYAVQAWRDAVLAGAYRKQAKHKQNALDAQNNLYGIIMASGSEAMQSIKKALQGSLKAKLLNKFEVSAIAASMAAITKQIQVSEWAGYNHKARIANDQKQNNTGKILRGFFNPLMWAPVLILGLALVGLDLMLARFNIATVGADGAKIQIALFAFCTLVVALVWLRVVRNRIVRENASDELSAVIMLMQANGVILASVAERSQMEMDEINSIVRKIAHKDNADQLMAPIKALAGLIASYKAVEVLNRQEIKPATSAQIKSELKAILDTNKRVVASKKLVITKTIPAGLNIGIGAELVALLMQTNLENAFEIAEKNGKVDIKFSQGVRNVSLNISSGGKALSRRMLHALEGPISNSRKLDAVGASLYLNQIIVESVGGKFEITSDSKTGTYVKIKLPKSNADINNFKPNSELDNPELAPFSGKVKPA